MSNLRDCQIPVAEIGNGGFFVSIDSNLYSNDAIVATLYKYTDRYYVHQQTSSENDNVINVVFEAKEDGSSISNVVVKQFCNDLIDQQVRVTINRDFGHIRDLIVEEAFNPVNNK